VCAVFLAEALLKTFSGSGLVPDAFVGAEAFLFAVALGAGTTVMLATLTGFPISTTHSLTGAILGSGLVAAGSQVNFSVLRQQFVFPLLLSPLLAVVIGAGATSYSGLYACVWGSRKSGVCALARRSASCHCRNPPPC
jgi:inorganic phosphate transporter, PiT family